MKVIHIVLVPLLGIFLKGILVICLKQVGKTLLRVLTHLCEGFSGREKQQFIA
jgi:hypothetical protein